MVGVLFLGAAAAATLSHLDWGRAALTQPKAEPALSLPPLELRGAPKEISDLVLEYLKDKPGKSLEQTAADVRRQFPCLESVAFGRPWFGKKTLLELRLRRPLGLATINRKAAGALSDGGIVFLFPEGLYGSALPMLEIDRADAAELKRLAAFLSAAAQSEALLSPLQSMRFISREEGWEAGFADGTKALWGKLNWTREKLTRLREVLTSARSEFGSGMTADLRYFEDGRILLRPMPTARPVGRR